jgi:hypothetical protein
MLYDSQRQRRRAVFEAAAVVSVGAAAFSACLLAEFLSRFFGALLGQVQWWADIAFDPSVWDCATYAWSSTFYVLVQQSRPYAVLFVPVAGALTAATILARRRLPLLVSAIVVASLGLTSWLAVSRGTGMSGTIDAEFSLRLTVLVAVLFPPLDRVLFRGVRVRDG